MGSGLVITGLSIADSTITPAMLSVDAAAKMVHGIEVQRATASLPATTTAAAFTIAGGRVKILQVLGEVTTVIQTQACNLKIQANPTAAGSSVDLCADLNVSAAAANSLLGITGTAANAMVNGMAVLGQVTPLIVQTGTLDLVTSATNTGAVKWTIRYIPMDAGATLVSA